MRLLCAAARCPVSVAPVASHVESLRSTLVEPCVNTSLVGGPFLYSSSAVLVLVQYTRVDLNIGFSRRAFLNFDVFFLLVVYTSS